MSIEEQVRIMEKQLEFFGTPFGKMQYMNQFFDQDPEYTKEARDIVRSNLCKTLSNDQL